MFWQWHAPCTSMIVPTSWPPEWIGTASSVGSLGFESAAFVHAASLSAAAFKSAGKLSCCAIQTVTAPLIKTRANKVVNFIGPEKRPYIWAIKGRYHTQPRQSVVQAGLGRPCMVGLLFPATITHPVAPQRCPSAENLYWKDRAKRAIFFCQDPVWDRPVSPASQRRPVREGTFHPEPGALPAPALIRSPHSN